MPAKINGQLYYSTSETCHKTAISRSTLSRWIKQGVLKRLYRDRRGWRMFTEDDLKKIKAETRKIKVEEIP